MLFWWLMLAGAVVGTLIIGGILLWLDDFQGDGYFFLALITGAVGFICSIIFLCIAIDYPMERNTCHAWGDRTNRPVKFATYNKTSWDCLTKGHDGKWISTSQIGDYNK